MLRFLTTGAVIVRNAASAMISTASSFTTSSSATAHASEAIRKRKAFGFGVRVSVWNLVYKDKSEDICRLCLLRKVVLAETSSWEIAHVIPFSLGGSDDIANLRPICRTCNRSMGKKHFIEYIAEMHPERSNQIIADLRL